MSVCACLGAEHAGCQVHLYWSYRSGRGLCFNPYLTIYMINPLLTGRRVAPPARQPLRFRQRRSKTDDVRLANNDIIVIIVRLLQLGYSFAEYEESYSFG